MKTQSSIFLLIIALFLGSAIWAQTSIQIQSDEGKVMNSRTEDIALFKEYMMVVSSAAAANSQQETAIWLDKVAYVAAAEITRSKANLQDLKNGKTEHLENWQKENLPDVKLNIGGEIHLLTSRIKHEEYLYEKLKNFDVSLLSEPRYVSTLRGYMNSFKRDMEKNLKYGGDIQPKKTTPPKTTSGTTSKYAKSNVEGSGFVLQSGKTKEIETGDPRLDDYYASQKLRKEEFQSGQAMFQKYMKADDDQMSKKAFKMLMEVMMNEANANSWFLNMINSGAVKVGNVDVNKLTTKINQQNALVEQAGKLKSKMSSEFGNSKSEISGLIDSFAATL